MIALKRFLLMIAIGIVATHATAGEKPMAQAGRAFVFDYGDLVLSVRYLSDKRLAWEQVKGPEIGLKAEEDYGYSEIRRDVYFIWWQEQDTSVVTQVVDFGKARVFTTFISPEKKVASFQGEIRPLR